MSWTDERVDKLKKFWSEGLSASQIAIQLGGVTRNAVIGKVHRLALLSRTKTAAKQDDSVECELKVVGVSTPPQPKNAPQASSYTSLKVVNAAGTGEIKAVQDSETASEIIKPVSCRLKLVELTENTCKWPFGDPFKDDFHFCGCKVSDSYPYCEYHKRIAYQKTFDRRKTSVNSN